MQKISKYSTRYCDIVHSLYYARKFCRYTLKIHIDGNFSTSGGGSG